MDHARRAVLRTARLVLRPVAASDESAVVSAIDDLAISGWLSKVPHPYTPADFQHFLTEIALPGEVFTIEDDTGFAGVMGLEECILGYWVAPRAQGRGYATEAARCVLAAHFGGSDDEVVSGYFEGNSRSARVLEKLGFVKTGRSSRYCAAMGVDRSHVELLLTRERFRAVLV
ncbi:GNAT family N-acetyltransferase [Tabrizicola sp.]|uniref:GNAT family N-acetyltransferase n=1 Tax=Tabrizicola sp. TaxID=2005166 RepID=UPI003F2BCB35